MKAALAALLLTGLTDLASAGSVGISPLRVQFSPDERSVVIRITNTGDDEITMQAEGMRWDQTEEGVDAYEATDSLVVVPPIFKVPPNETQTVRVGLVEPKSPEEESAYRLFFTELPPPLEEGRIGFMMRMRISIPAFVPPLIDETRDLKLVAFEQEAESLRVRLYNPGNSHVRISRLLAFAGDAPQERPSAGYVLAGSHRDFQIDLPPDFSADALQAVTDQVGVREYDLIPSQ